MNKTKKSLLGLLLLLAAAAGILCGCGQADDAMQENSDTDHLSGVYIIQRSRQEAVDKKIHDEQGNLVKNYAKETKPEDTVNYDFGDLGGAYLFLEQTKDGVNRVSSEAVANGALRIEVNEVDGAKEDKSILSGSVHFKKGAESEFLCYPIRKDQEGYYLGEQGTSGIDASGGADLSGDASWPVREDGEQMTQSLAYEIHFEEEAPIRTVIAREMDKNDQVIKSTEIHFKENAYNLKLQPKTEYVIVEETAVSESGKAVKTHNLYDWKSPDDDEEELAHYSYISDQSDILRPQKMTFTKETR